MNTELAKAKILIVDDEPLILKAIKGILADANYQIHTEQDGLKALALIKQQPFDLALIDLRLPGISGMELLSEIKMIDPDMVVIMMTAYATVETALGAVKAGAYDYITKPFENIDSVALSIEKALERKKLLIRNRFLESQLHIQDRFEEIIGKSKSMRSVFQLIESVAPTDATVLIQGESGTGKELVARAMHKRSKRSHRQMISVNCSALTETLLESELFGHIKGSFTGATTNKMGLFEAANHGTIFLDEIGEIPLSTQVKLLRVLQEGEIKRVGAHETLKVNTRIIAATNADLKKAQANGTFREDLYYRLNVINISIPSLRERIEDIPLLAYHFLRKYTSRMNKSIEGIDPETLNILQHHHWTGNVRELENVIERAVVLGQGNSIRVFDLPDNINERSDNKTSSDWMVHLTKMPFQQAKQYAVGNFEKLYVEELLKNNQGNVSKAAQSAGLDRSNFRRILTKYDVDPNQFKTSR